MRSLIENFCFLPFILYLGITCSLEDMRNYKVKNKWIVIGLVWGILIYAVSGVLWGWKATDYMKVMLNTSFAFFISLLVWRLGFWAAGDAKLFTTFSFLIPLKYYGQEGAGMFFPSFIFLANIFTFILLFLLFETSIKILYGIFLNFSEFSNKLYLWYEAIKRKLREKIIMLLRLIWGYLCIFILMRLLKEKISSLGIMNPSFIIFCYAMLFLLFRPLTKMLKKYNSFILFITVLLAVSLAFDFKRQKDFLIIDLLGYLKYFFSFIGLVFIFSKFMEKYVEKKEVREINIGELQSNMQLTEKTLANLKFKDSDTFYADGLTKDQVKRIKAFFLNHKDNKFKLEIYSVLPLAPFIFIGALLTILLRGYIYRIF